MSDWIERTKRKRAILLDRKSSCLAGLREKIAGVSHLAAALWALDAAGTIARELSLRHPEEDVFFEAVSLSRAWAEGKIKMPEAKRAILRCHAFAKTVDDPVDRALCHALAQGCSTVHVETHALGLAFYALTALIHQKEGCPVEEIQEALSEKITLYQESLDYWTVESTYLEKEALWADFLVRPGSVNRERLLLEKEAMQP